MKVKSRNVIKRLNTVHLFWLQYLLSVWTSLTADIDERCREEWHCVDGQCACGLGFGGELPDEGAGEGAGGAGGAGGPGK